MHKKAERRVCCNKPVHKKLPSTETQNKANKMWLVEFVSEGKRATTDRHKVTGLQVGFPGARTETGTNHRTEIMGTEG